MREIDPSGNTEAFRAFTEKPPEERATGRAPLIIGAAFAAVVVIAVIIWATV